MNIAGPVVMSEPRRIERRKAQRGTVQNLVTKWKLFVHPSYFVQCPCKDCGGMVSIRECMVQGEIYWFCSEESRKDFESYN